MSTDFHTPSMVFAEESSTQGDTVYRTGLIFKAGTYDSFVCTPEDLDAAVAAFTPVDVETEHFDTRGQKSIFTGKMGQLQKVWHDGAGNLFGTVGVPSWLDPLWSAAGRKVSVVLGSGTKHLQKIGFTLNPRVKEAAMMSAYEAFSEYAAFAASTTGARSYSDISSLLGETINANRAGSMPRYYIQEVYPEEVVLCNYEDDSYYQASYSIDDNGKATIGEMQPVTRRTIYEPVTFSRKVGAAVKSFAGRRHSRKDQKALQSIHDIATEQGAACTPPAMMSTPGGTTVEFSLDIIKMWRGFTASQRAKLRESGAEGPPEETLQVIDQAAAQAQEERIAEQNKLFATKHAELEAKLEEANKQTFIAMSMRVEAEATGYIDGLITAGVALPRERESLISMYRQNAIDDGSHGVATFSDGTTGSRVEQFKALMKQRPPLKIIGDKIVVREDETETTVAMSGANPGAPDPDKLDQKGLDSLLGASDRGKIALAQRKTS